MTTVWVSVTSGGSALPALCCSSGGPLSGTGGVVVFVSAAGGAGHWEVRVRDLGAKKTSDASVGRHGAAPNGNSDYPSVSGDGRFVVFSSTASNLVAGDLNQVADVFVRDRKRHVTRLLSVGRRGGEGNRVSYAPVITRHGRYVGFISGAWNLVAHDTNRRTDGFIRDRQTGITRRIDISTSGGQANGPTISVALASGARYVAFESLASNLVAHDVNHASDIFIRDRVSHRTRVISVSSTGRRGDGSSREPSISANGRYVVFNSAADTLVPGDTNQAEDVFIRDVKNHTTHRISVSSSGAQANNSSFLPQISSDGRYVVFESSATNLVPSDTNGVPDIFIRDRVAKTTTRVSLTATGGQADNSSSGFDAGASFPYISADGRYVTFLSDSDNLVTGDTDQSFDIFRRGPFY